MTTSTKRATTYGPELKQTQTDKLLNINRPTFLQLMFLIPVVNEHEKHLKAEHVHTCTIVCASAIVNVSACVSAQTEGSKDQVRTCPEPCGVERHLYPHN